MTTGSPSESVAGVNCRIKHSIAFVVSSVPRVLLQQCFVSSPVVIALCMALMEGRHQLTVKN